MQPQKTQTKQETKEEITNDEIQLQQAQQKTNQPASSETKQEKKTQTQETKKKNESESKQVKNKEQTKKDSSKKAEEKQKKEQKKEEKKQEKMEEKKEDTKISKTMKCVMLTGPKTAEFKEVDVPKPASGEVLIKVMAAPINPSDIALYDGHYSHQKKFPTIMGFEGSGLVVESGGGLMGWGLQGKKVAFGAQKQGLGSYAQYVVAKSEECLPLSDDTSFEQGAMSLINPLTAIGMLDVIKSRKETCVVLTAAASALCRMMNRIYPKQGVQVINIVRRPQQIQILKAEGAKHIFNSSTENWEKQFRQCAEKLGAKTCFQAVGGEFTAVVARNMPKNSFITIYGCLSGKNIQNLEVMDLLVNNKTVNSFLLGQWLKTKNQLTLLPTFYKVRSAINQSLKSNVAKKFKLSEANEAIKYYLSHMSDGKILFEPWSE